MILGYDYKLHVSCILSHHQFRHEGGGCKIYTYIYLYMVLINTNRGGQRNRNSFFIDAWASNLDCHDCLSARLPAVPTLPVGTKKNQEIILHVEIISLSILCITDSPTNPSTSQTLKTNWTHPPASLPACQSLFPFSPHNTFILSYYSSHHASPPLINIKAHTSLPTHAHKQLIWSPFTELQTAAFLSFEGTYMGLFPDSPSYPPSMWNPRLR